MRTIRSLCLASLAAIGVAVTLLGCSRGAPHSLPPPYAASQLPPLPAGVVRDLAQATHPPPPGANWPPEGTDVVVNVRDGSILVPMGGSGAPAGTAAPDQQPEPGRAYIGAHPVTNDQYQRFLCATGHTRPKLAPFWGKSIMSESEFVALGADTGMAPPLREEDVLRRVWWSGPAPPEEASAAPVVGVTWDDAAAYCEWAGLRLPSTSEWELACRGPERFVYPWGNDFDSSRCGRGLDSVWSFLPSQSVCGAVGMCGPINEWCASATGATAESEVAQAPIRGLGWVSYRVAYLWPAGAAVPGGLPCVPWREDAMFPSRWTIDTGFRVAWTCPSGTG